MLIAPRGHKVDSDFFSKTYMSGRVSYDTGTQMSEIEKKYQPYITKLNSLVKEIDTEIKQSQRKAKEMLEQFPKKVEIETESAKNRTSLYSTKMSVLKMIMGAIKDIKDIEMKEQKLVHDMTGKVVDVKGGNVSMKATIAGLIDNNISAAPKTIHMLGGYGEPPVSVVSEAKSVPVNETPEPTADVQPKTDGQFTGLFSKVVNPDENKYIVGNKNAKDYETMDDRFSYTTAQTGIKNKYLQNTMIKCHYDEERNIGWLRTYDKETGDIVKEETIVSPSYYGKIAIMNSGGTRYAITETEDNYDIVPDKFENAPDTIKDELLLVNGYKNNNGE